MSERAWCFTSDFNLQVKVDFICQISIISSLDDIRFRSMNNLLVPLVLFKCVSCDSRSNHILGQEKCPSCISNPKVCNIFK